MTPVKPLNVGTSNGERMIHAAPFQSERTQAVHLSEGARVLRENALALATRDPGSALVSQSLVGLCSPSHQSINVDERDFLSSNSFLTPVLVPVRASPVPSVVRGSFLVKFFPQFT